MKIEPGQIGFDIDCVVADTMEAFIRLARDNHGLTVKPEEITAFQVEDCLDLAPNIVDEIFQQILDEPLSCRLKPMADAVEVLSELATTAPLTFITARPTSDPIKEWLMVMLGEDICRQMTLIATGEHDNKGDHIRQSGLSHFIDDRASTCIRLAAEGISPIVFTQPWNHGRHNLPTVESWRCIRNLCLPPRPADQSSWRVSKNYPEIK